MHHSTDAQIILVGRSKGLDSDTNDSGYSKSARQEDGTRLARLIGAVAYLEINSEAPRGDPGLEELVDVLAWATSRL